MPITNQTLTMSGPLIERKIYGKFIPYGPYTKSSPGKRGPRKEDDKTPEERAESMKMSINRAKAKLRQLSFANAWEWRTPNGKIALPLFITYTFAKNITDTKEAHKLFTRGMERFNYQWRMYLPEGLKYVAVAERQNRGAIHYHQIVFNLPFIPKIYDWARETWGMGRVNIKAINDPRGLSVYLVKYMSKDMKSGRSFNGKRYLASRKLIPPTVLRNRQDIQKVLDQIPPETEFRTTTIKNEHVGTITYETYMLPTHSVSARIYKKVLEKGVKLMPPTEGTDDTPRPVMPLNN